MRTGTDPTLLTPGLDALDDAFARHGIDNLTGTVRAYRPLPGAGEPSGDPGLGMSGRPAMSPPDSR